MTQKAEATKQVVLVVEDDPNLRRLIARHLDKMGFATAEVDDGEACLAWLDTHPVPALICLDLALPSMSGFRVCEQVRSSSTTREVPVLVITARSTVQDHTFALEMGADAFLEKPFKLKDFENEVKALLSGH